MPENSSSFKVGIDFQSVLRAISKQIYETPLAFIRENVQNAVDAVRIQALRENKEPDDSSYQISVKIQGRNVIVCDNGIGMTAQELQDYFWTIGASGKRTAEAFKAGCVGMFGIGGFANFGICEKVEVISQANGADIGTLTSLSEADIKESGSMIPSVHVEPSRLAAPRGTIVTGYLRDNVNNDELLLYLKDFVRFVPVKITFNDTKISQLKFSSLENKDNLKEITSDVTEWVGNGLTISGRLFQDKGTALIAQVLGLNLDGKPVSLDGQLRFENGSLDVFKRGFKLCATQIGTTVGVSGRLDSDQFTPTAGRDSLDGPTISILGKIISVMEEVVIENILQDPERIAQHTRIFRYVWSHNWIDKLRNVKVHLADGSEALFEDIKRKAGQGSIKVYYGLSQKQGLNQIMQARGHIVVLLSADRHRQTCEKAYLERFCDAKPFDGIIDCVKLYEELSRFERVFLSELEMSIQKSYEVKNFSLIPGKLTEDIPVYVKENAANQSIEIYVDVRHFEIAKLEDIGFSQLLYSLISTFCREYLGSSLKKFSPRFFGDGAINLELLSKRRSELWILLKDDISVLHKESGQRQVMNTSDVGIVRVNAAGTREENIKPEQTPRILQIIDDSGNTGLAGYYVRLLDSAYKAYGDLLPECEHRGIVWAGNKILYVLSDAVSSAFQYEIRLDEIISVTHDNTVKSEGALQISLPLQELYGSVYFPIPEVLRPFLVPTGSAEIRVELHIDWIDMRTSKHWIARETSGKN